MAAVIDCCQLPCGATLDGRWPARTPSQRPTTLPASRHKQLYSLAAKYEYRTCFSRLRSASSSKSHQSSDAAPQFKQSTATADALTQEQSWQLLEDFTRLNVRGLDQSMLDSPLKRARLRQASLVRLLNYHDLLPANAQKNPLTVEHREHRRKKIISVPGYTQACLCQGAGWWGLSLASRLHESACR